MDEYQSHRSHSGHPALNFRGYTAEPVSSSSSGGLARALLTNGIVVFGGSQGASIAGPNPYHPVALQEAEAADHEQFDGRAAV